MTHLIVYDTNNNAHILDLKDEGNVYLTKQFASISDFTIKGGYSQSFRIPMTERNASFFSPLWNPNNLTFDFGKKIEAEIQVDTLPIEKGYLQVQKVYSKGEMWHEIDAQFFSNVPNLATEIGEKKISDIQDLTSLNHLMLFDNVPQPFAHTDLLYGIADRGQRFSENLNEIYNTGAKPVLSGDNPLYVNDLTPFVNVKYLFDNVFADANFTYESTTLDGILEDYYMPFINSQFSATEETVEDLYFFAITTGATLNDFTVTIPTANIYQSFPLNGSYLVEVADNGSNLSPSMVYSADFTGTYEFSIRLGVKIANPYPFFANINSTCYARIVDNTTNAILYQASFVAYTYDTLFQINAPVSLLQGQSVRLEVAFQKIVYNYLGTFYTFDTYELNSNGWWRLNLVPFNTIMQSGTMDVPKCAPDYKQIDLVRDIIKMHNLVIIPSQTDARHLIIEPMTIYLGSGNTDVDWTHKLDLTKDVVLYSPKAEQNKTFLWTYKAGGEYLSQLYVSAGRTYGEYKIFDTGNDFATGENKMELQLASTPLNEINGMNIPIPKFINEQGQFVASGARCLYLVPQTMEVSLWNEDTSEAELKTIKLFSHYSELNPSVTDYDLNFAPETPLQVIVANPYNNLWNLYWRRYYNELYSDEARTMEAYFLLDPVDYYNIKFNDIIYIKDSYWRLIDIEGYALDKRISVKCKLVKFLSVVLTDCDLTPSAIGLSGQVFFSDGVDDDLNGSQECCELYGYTWSTEKGQCYAIGGRAGQPSQVNINTQQVEKQNVTLGSNNIIEQGNDLSIVSGNNNKATTDVNGSLIIGNGIDAPYRGIHYGDGSVDTGTAIKGRSQGGILMASGFGDYAATGDKIELFLNGGSDYINLEDGVNWMIEVNAIGLTPTGERHSLSFFTHIWKDTTAASGVGSKQYDDGDFGACSLSIDTTTNTAEHRLSIQSTTATYPINDVHWSATIKYTQTL